MKPERRPLIAGNWKMQHGGATACHLAHEIAAEIKDIPEVDVLVAPPFTALAAVAAELESKRVQVAGQNLHDKDSGAYTGEISGAMLVECGAAWVLVGHSERRALFGEDNAWVAAKTEAAFRARLRPIVCIGETLAERDAGKTLDIVMGQLGVVLPILEREPGHAALAYEPVWAIGTGRNAEPAQVEEVHSALREALNKRNANLAHSTRLLYGGSVKGENASALLECPDVDGALVGGASLQAVSFLAIISAAARIARNPS